MFKLTTQEKNRVRINIRSYDSNIVVRSMKAIMTIPGINSLAGIYESALNSYRTKEYPDGFDEYYQIEKLCKKGKYKLGWFLCHAVEKYLEKLNL